MLSTTENRFRQIMEWRETGNDFRWVINVRRSPQGQLFWWSWGEFLEREPPWPWECKSSALVPLDEWFTFEVFWKLGETDGRVWAAADGQTLLDYTGRTMKDSGLYVWWPFKIYLGEDLKGYTGPPIWQLVDDFELYADPPAVMAPGQVACEVNP